jgi:hypothetical protein
MVTLQFNLQKMSYLVVDLRRVRCVAWSHAAMRYRYLIPNDEHLLKDRHVNFKSISSNSLLNIQVSWLLSALTVARTYTIYTKVCGHPFKWVDSAISAIPVAVRCIKSSTQPFNLHRQTLAVKWPYWRTQWLSTWHPQNLFIRFLPC